MDISSDEFFDDSELEKQYQSENSQRVTKGGWRESLPAEGDEHHEQDLWEESEEAMQQESLSPEAATPRRALEMVEVGVEEVSKMKEALEGKGGVGTIRKMIQVFKDVVKEVDTAAPGTQKRNKAYLIYDHNVLNMFIKYMLEEFPQFLVQKAKLSEVEEGKVEIGEKKLESACRTYINTIAGLLENQSEPKMVSYICIQLNKHMQLLQTFHVSEKSNPRDNL